MAENKDNIKKKRTSIFSVSVFMHGCYHLFAACILASLFATFFEMLIPRIISYTVDSVIGGNTDNGSLINSALSSLRGGRDLASAITFFTVTVMVLAVFMGLFKYLQMVYNRKASETLTAGMKDRLFYHVERLPFSWFSDHQTGDIIQRCTSDVETVKEFMAEQLPSVISTIILITLSLAFMYSVNWKVATISLAFIPLIVIFSLMFHLKIGDEFEKADENEAKLSAICQENLTGIRVVRAFGREREEIAKYKKQNELYAESWVKLGKWLTMFWMTGDMLSGLPVLAILTAGTILCVNNELEAGELVALIMYNAMMTWPVRSLGRMFSEMSKAGVSVGRIREILDAPIEKDTEGAVSEFPDGDIVFDDVTFSFEKERPVLDGVSLTIPRGSTLGVIGMTGSGKSTLASLICRLYDPDSGSITIGGRDIKDIKLDTLRRNVSIVMQEPFLFSRTILDNIGITFDAPSENSEKIIDAARIAHLDESISEFTKGYDTMVGERGVTLSGGQKQRAAIARALATGAPVKIFDDSLSAVDSETDAKIRASLRENMENDTVIIISHRIQTIMSADNIIVMSDGKIVESGTHAELAVAGGIYSRLYEIQSMTAEDREGGEADG